MKKKLLSVLLVLSLCLTLCAAAFAEPDVHGDYYAASCTRDGEEYNCEGEYLTLSDGGEGSVMFENRELPITWKLDGSDFYFADNEGNEMHGSYADGVISGSYAGYDFVYKLSDTSVSLDGALVGTYFSFDDSTEYIIVNANGSGMLVSDGYAYWISCTVNGSQFTFTDNVGEAFEGTISGGTISGNYRGEDHAYTKTGESAPIMSLSPGDWNSGLDYVFDQAGLLSQSEVDDLSARAREISERYGCNVYIVTLDDFTDYSLGNSIELCAEEIRSGYDLGNGADHNMVMLVLSMAERDYDLMAHGGIGNSAFTDYVKSVVEDEFLDDFADDDWYNGFSDYLKHCGIYLSINEDEMSDNHSDIDDGYGYVGYVSGVSIFIAVLIGFVVALVICIGIRKKMRPVKEQSNAHNYITKNGVDITLRSDVYTHTTETRVYDPPNDDHGDTSIGSSGSSHSSGKF